MLKSNRFLSIFSFVTAYQIFGYPVNACISILLGINSQNVSLFLRLCFLIFYVLTFTFFILLNKVKKLNKSFLVLIIFWIIYSVRFLFDTIFNNYIYSGYNFFNSLLLLYGVTVIPLVATYYIFESKMLKKFVFFSYILLIISNFLLFYLNINGLTQIDLDKMRLAVSDMNDNLIVNSITISMTGALLFIFSISKLLFFKLHSTKINITKLLTHLTFLTLGLTNLILGASRGPLFTTIIILFFVYILYMFKKNTFFVPLILGSSLIFLFTVFFNTQNSNILIFTRALSFFEERQNNIEEGRDIEFASAIKQFSSSPIIGDKIITNSSNWFPHNIILESLMSIGIIGTIFLVLIIFYCINKCKKILFFNTHDALFLIIIFFELFSSVLISGSIPLSNSFWIVVAVLLTIKINKKSHNILLNRKSYV
jgi:O-antigen ligase